MTFEEAAALLRPEVVARLTADPAPLRPEQIRRVADLVTREPNTDKRPDAA
jgi:hypothetical protein